MNNSSNCYSTPTRSSSSKKKRKTSVLGGDDSSTPLSYTPVLDLAPDSPLRQQGNLTGVPRKLKDQAADWHNAKLKWAKASQSGFLLCSQIGNIKMDSFVDSNPLPESLLPLCDELSAVINTLDLLFSKMCRRDDAVHGIRELLTQQGNQHQLIFQTWTINHFVRASEQLTELYRNELRLKRSIKENICHSQCKEELMFLLACWTHEPYLEQATLTHIQAMLIETGHETN